MQISKEKEKKKTSNIRMWFVWASIMYWAPSGVRARLTRGRSEIDPCHLATWDFFQLKCFRRRYNR